MAAPKDVEAFLDSIRQPPPPGSPYGLPVPGTETSNRTAAYRQFHFVDRPLLSTLNPQLPTIYHLIEDATYRHDKKRALGWRSWDVAKQAWTDKYEWMNFAEFRERKNNLGAGIVELHDRIGEHKGGKYGVGILSQNRPEWQIAGKVP